MLTSLKLPANIVLAILVFEPIIMYSQQQGWIYSWLNYKSIPLKKCYEPCGQSECIQTKLIQPPWDSLVLLLMFKEILISPFLLEGPIIKRTKQFTKREPQRRSRTVQMFQIENENCMKSSFLPHARIFVISFSLNNIAMAMNWFDQQI